MMNFSFSAEKNEILKRERGIGFEEIITIIEEEGAADVIGHPPGHRYAHQIVFQVRVKGYIYSVPAVIHGDGFFLKTIFPNRKAMKKYK